MLRIRLRRMGTKHRPFYRVVVSDSRKSPKASAIDEVGCYEPGADPERIQIDSDRLAHWVERGAKVTPTVRRLLRRQTAPTA